MVWGALVATISAIAAAAMVFPSHEKPLPIYGSLPDFTLQDQNNQNTTLESLSGSVCVADVIFTRCAGQCLQMSATMKEIQAALPEPLPVKLISFTTDPTYDTPSVLKKYGER